MPETKGSRYSIEKEIGRGAFGTVYLARDNLLRRDVALKVMTVPDGLSEEERQHFIDRFYREARAAAGLSHPSIVIIHDISKARDKYFISMELLEGEPLARVMEEQQLSTSRVLRLADRILAGLEYAHSRDVIHRDIKPDNIFVLDGDGVKIVDFGLARVQASTTITKTGAVMGSPGYIAPEVIDGLQADKRTDVFSFGVLFYEMLTGVRPFGPDTAFESFARVIYRIMSEDPQPASKVNPAVPAALDPVISRMLAKDPATRFQDAGELRQGLAAATAALDLVEDRATAVAPAGKKVETPAEVTTAIGGEVTVAGQPARRDQDVVKTEILALEQDLALETGTRGKPRRRTVTLITAGALLVCAGVAVLLLFLFGVFGSSVVKVPNVVNLDKAVAMKTVKNAGLRVGKVEDVFMNDIWKGKVAQQLPAAGTSVPKNSSVELRVSMGNKVSQVPDLVGTPQDQARQTLTAYQFKIKTVGGFSETIPVGSVVALTPKPGTLRPWGSTITMFVNTGQKPAKPNTSTPGPKVTTPIKPPSPAP